MSDIEMITVEVAYALPKKQKIVELLVQPGTTALQAAKRSGLEKEFPEIDYETAKMGIFGQALGTKGLKKANEHELQPGDRVEIYRPLTSDPKEVRRKRAAKAKEVAEGDK
ncbi:RnfH family protein [Aestuariicella sp. G3-2]|uniref:RnfH family protein n=1 Tax=Pseudomaricurvus albidus TaxID=2842452 RepID=UPI001C0D3D13|nr:RnfH family protein [Aestuariicella albida]MBU3069280.1 RnfH family protein [Aestuariicella albida]